MSRSKKLIILAATLAVVALAAFFLISGENRKAEEEAAASMAQQPEVLMGFSVDTDTITDITWRCLSRSASVTREGDDWVFTDESGVKQVANKEKVQQVLDVIRSIPAERVIDEPGDLAQFGFNDPCAEVHFDAAGQHYDLIYGDPCKSNQDLYYFINGDGKLYMVSGNETERFYKNYNDLLSEE